MYMYDVTKQNGCCSVGILYRDVLGKIVFPYDSVYKIRKRAKVRHIVYNAIQISLVVSESKNFWHAFLIEARFVLSWYVYYFLPLLSHGSMCKNTTDNIHFEYCVLVSKAPTLTRPFCQL